jgi:hypothetical protein
VSERPSIHVNESHPRLIEWVRAAFRDRAFEVVEWSEGIDATLYLHDEAPLLDVTELAEAEAALREDGIFSEREWTEVELRAAVKYGWALAHAAQETRDERIHPVLWFLGGGEVPTTAAELRFLVHELSQRSIPVDHLAVCWPVTLEPACEAGERAEAFLRVVGEYTSAIRGSRFGLTIPHATGKVVEFRSIAEQLGTNAVFEFNELGWLEAARVLASRDAALFRRVLACAQEHFALDKPRGAIATTEDDIRMLPEVDDADLARVFLDDFRGRQLLYVTAPSIFDDEVLGEALGKFLNSAEVEIVTAIRTEIDRHVVPA